MTSADFRELSQELTKLAENAVKCAEKLDSSDEPSFGTFGIQNAVEGCDSLATAFAQVISPYESRKPKLEVIRAKIDDAKSKKVDSAAAKLQLIENEPSPKAKPKEKLSIHRQPEKEAQQPQRSKNRKRLT